MIVIGVILIFVILYFFGEAGFILAITLCLGLFFSMYMRIRQLADDMLQIKEKLGIEDHRIEDAKDFHMKNEEIEKELELYIEDGHNDNEPSKGVLPVNREFAFSRIGYVYIPTISIDESIAWYTENLAFKLMNKFQDRGSYLAVLHHPHQHSIALLLIETRERRPLEIIRNGKPFPIMALNCPDIEYTHQLLKERGVAVEDLHTLGAGEAKYFYFRDPEGNLLEAAWSIWDPKDDYKEDKGSIGRGPME